MKNRLKHIRRDQNMAQTSFGKSLGVARDVISNYEMERVNPTDWVCGKSCVSNI